ncbi:hypothetical protein F5Y12DRAFT_398932 [Xylaria sp. FL1777]|nr:hypothetical protein F5Y12DRAFT_398932 [Xylaria sp. FL1777]
MPSKHESREYRPITRAFLVAHSEEQIRLAAAAAEKKRLAAAGEGKDDESAEPENKGDELETEFRCGMDDWEKYCDVVLEECEDVLLTNLGDKDDLTDDGSDSDSDVVNDLNSGVAMEEKKEDSSDSSNRYSSGPEPREPVDPAFDNEYFESSDDDDMIIDPRSYEYQMPVENFQDKLERESFDQEVKANDEDLYPKLLKQLGDVDAGREPRTLESMVKPKKKKKKYNSDGDSECESNDDASPTEAGPESEAGADLFDFPMLRPKALQRVINFFRSHPHVRRKDCEDFCKRIYKADLYKTSRYKSGPSEVGPDWKWPSGPGFQRPPGVLAYPSQFQFDDDVYVVQVEGEIEEGSGLPEPTGIGIMTLFYFTFEELDVENQLESAREVYGEYVPHYKRVGHMALPPKHRPLFVWRIDCPAGQPFSTDASYFGLRINRQMYASILRDLVDFVAAPLALLGSEGEEGEGEEIDVQQLLQAWPMVLHNPRIDADNIIVGSDYKSMVGLLRWTTPSVVTLPLGASLLGLLSLEGTPLQEPGDIELTRWSTNTDFEAAFHQRPVRKNVDRFPFETHSCNAYDLERLMLLYVQAKVPALAQHPEIEELWKHLFSAMRQAVDAADYMADGDKESYRQQIGRMEWDWFHFPEIQFLGNKKDAQGDDEGYQADVEKMEIDG